VYPKQGVHSFLTLIFHRQQKICCLLKVVASCPRLSAIQRLVNHWFYITDDIFVQIVIKIPSLYNHFPSLSKTYVIFHDFLDLENSLIKFHDSPRLGDTL